MARRQLPRFPMFEPPPDETSRSFEDFNQHQDMESWIGRACTIELPTLPMAGGAGGNADGSGDPIDHFVADHKGSLIVGPESPMGKKGNARS